MIYWVQQNWPPFLYTFDFNNQKYLEALMGLDKLFEEGKAVLKSVVWEDEGENEPRMIFDTQERALNVDV